MSTGTLELNSSNRSWATREYACFQGTFKLDAASGLYFDSSTPEVHKARIRATFACMPSQLMLIARRMQLTVSTTAGRTRANHSYCTIYGNWSNYRPSPHLEISLGSLSTDLFFGHLVHELSHLWWFAGTEPMRRQFEHELVESQLESIVEITDYVHAKYLDWLHAIKTNQPGGCQKAYLRLWVLESFAESSAACAIEGYQSAECNVDIELRRSMIQRVADLDIETISKEDLAAVPEL